MTRDEYLAVLEHEPVTENQRGRIMHECDRLGLVDRAERLAVLAAVLGVDELGSTEDLTMGQGGQLVAILTHTRDRAELPDVDEDQDDEPAADLDAAAEQISIAEVLQRLALVIYAAFGGAE